MRGEKQLGHSSGTATTEASSVRLTMPALEVRHAMSTDVITVSSDQTALSTAKIMAKKGISCLIVVDHGDVVGILTEKDFLTRMAGGSSCFDTMRVAQIMSSPVEHIGPDLSVLRAGKTMTVKHIKRLPVLSEKRLVGLVTQTDVTRALTSYGMWKNVAEIMSPDVVVIQTHATVAEAATIMASRSISCIVALKGDEAVGMLTERDILRKVIARQKDPAETRIVEVMSHPLMAVSPGFSVFSASSRMDKAHLRRLVVMKDKKVCGLVTQTDILQAIRKKLQAEERESLRLLESSESNIYIIDLNGKTTYVNPAFMKLLEISEPNEIINQPFLSEPFWFHPKERTRFSKELKGGGVEIDELVLRTAKGNKIYASLFSSFIRNVHGEIEGSRGILCNITDRKRVEKELQDSEERHRVLFESSRDAIMTLAPPSWQFTSGNQAAVKLFGFRDEDELTSLGPWNVSPEHQPDGRPSTKEMIETAVREGANFFEWTHKRLDGKEFPSMVLLTRMELGGQTLLQCTVRDITKRREAEREQQRAFEALEEAHHDLKTMQSQFVQNEKLASIGQLAAGVAHEMNTPVGFVASNFQTLESYMKKFLDMFAMYEGLAANVDTGVKEDRLRQIEEINKARAALKIDFILGDIQQLFDDSKEGVSRITSIVQNLRDFSRVDQAEDVAEYDLNAGIQATLVVARNEIKYDADLITELSGDLPWVGCHSGQINQVILNILVNAAHAIKSQQREDKGTIAIRTFQIDDEVVCEISDNGPGIPADVLSKIFDPFFTTKPPGKGTGLGLSVSYDIIVNKHKGALLVDSTVGEGTTFTIKLPIRTEEPDNKREVLAEITR